MTTLKSFSCLMLSGTMVVSAGCGGGKKPYVQKGTEQISKTIVVNNCTANPDTAAVFATDTLTWTSTDGSTYTVTFNATAPVANASFPVSSTPASQHVHRTFGCWLNWNNCYYGYSLSRNNVPCPDPGVHIIPGTQ